LGLFWPFSAGIRGIFVVEMERERIQPLDEAHQAVLRLIRADRFLRPEFLYDLRQARLLSSPTGRSQHILIYVDFRMRYLRMRYLRNRIDQ
jgi:hypothetical protein